MATNTPWWKKTPVLIGGVAVLAIVIGGGTAAVVIKSGKSSEEPRATPTVTATAAPTTVSASPIETTTSATPAATASESGAKSQCGADDSDQSMPSEASPIIADSWPNVHGMGIPVSSTYGPVQRDGEIWTCFAHSPRGAVQAAAYISGIGATPEGRRTYYANVPEDMVDKVIGTNTSAGNNVALEAYKIRAYDKESAIVEVGLTVPLDGQAHATSTAMVLIWQNGWKLDWPQMNSNSVTQIPGFSGYLTWQSNS